MTEEKELLSFALEAARAGGEVALAHYRRNPRAERKPNGTWVTAADRAGEARIRNLVAERFPDHNVLGEEEGLTAAAGGSPHDGAPTWIVDPIDGTNNFMAGIPVWATLVALERDGDVVLGVCCAPALDETYEAVRGGGARLNGSPIAVSARATLSDATLVTVGFETFEERGLGDFYLDLVRSCHRSRGFGDFWGHMLVARGAADVMVEPELATWDFAALIPIVEEAGGRITTLEGAPPRDGGSCITTNGILHEEVLALRTR